MSFQRTYLHTLAVATDDLLAALLFNRDDVTISSLCGLYRRATGGDPRATAVLAAMDLKGWQRTFLRVVGNGLERILPGHCERAVGADILRGQAMVALLED